MYYHISSKDFGPKFKFIPKVPETAGPKECLKTERVCFAPTIWQCLVSVSGIGGVEKDRSSVMLLIDFLSRHNNNNPVVYVTQSKSLVTPKAKGKTDFKITGERWSTKPITLTRKGYVDMVQLVLGRIKITQKPEHDFTAREIKIIRSLISWTVK